MSITVSNTRRTNYDCTWNSVALGGVNKVDLSKLTLLLEPVKIGSLGNMKLDDRIIGLEDKAMITIELREVTRAIIQKMMPWATQTTGAKLDFMPAVNTLMASYAQALLLHPRDVADVSQDLSIYKATPVQAFNLTRDGTKDDVWEVMFMIYPDLTKLPNNPYGEIIVAP